jgi:hypothetical protein
MSPGWTLAVEILGAIASLVVVLEWCGVKPKGLTWGLIFPLNKNWKLVIMLFVLAATVAMSVFSFIRSLQPKVQTVTRTIETPSTYPFIWHADAPLTYVTKRFFQNEVVPLDGMSYKYCVFRHVTFKFNGTGPMQVEDDVIQGDTGMTTENPAVLAAIATASVIGYPPPQNIIGPDGRRILNAYDLKHVKKLPKGEEPEWMKEMQIPEYK